jgi:hypothetical protein
MAAIHFTDLNYLFFCYFLTFPPFQAGIENAAFRWPTRFKNSVERPTTATVDSDQLNQTVNFISILPLVQSIFYHANFLKILY